MDIVSETLHRAADLIAKRGWTTGTWGGGASSSAPVCMEGAIAAAMDLHIGSADAMTAEENHAFVEMLNCPAYAAVKEYLGLKAPDADLWHFNDANGRTAAEVIEVLRAAAVIEAAKERTEVTA